MPHAASEAVEQLQTVAGIVEVSWDEIGRLSRLDFGQGRCVSNSFGKAYDDFASNVWPFVATAAGVSPEDSFHARVEPWGPMESPLGYVVVLERWFKGLRVLGEEMRILFRYDLSDFVEPAPMGENLLGLKLAKPKEADKLCLWSIEANLTRGLEGLLKNLEGPTITPEEASVIAMGEVKLEDLPGPSPKELGSKEELTIVSADGRPRIAWRVSYHFGDISIWTSLVDALSGGVIESQGPVKNGLRQGKQPARAI